MIGAGGSNIITGSIAAPTRYNAIVAGTDNKIKGNDRSIIGAGYSNNIDGSTNAIIGAGYNSEILFSDYSMIGTGWYNSIDDDSDYSIIGAGSRNTISSSASSSIIAGGGNLIQGYDNVHILGSNITATQANTTYAENIIADGDISSSGNFFFQQSKGIISNVGTQWETNLISILGNLYFYSGSSTNDTIFRTDSDTKRVMIGSNGLPQKTLTVAGSISASGDFHFQQSKGMVWNEGTQWETQLRSILGNLYFYSGSSTNDTIFRTDSDTKRVMIGSNGLPQATLHVAGDISASGAVYTDQITAGSTNISLNPTNVTVGTDVRITSGHLSVQPMNYIHLNSPETNDDCIRYLNTSDLIAIKSNKVYFNTVNGVGIGAVPASGMALTVSGSISASGDITTGQLSTPGTSVILGPSNYPAGISGSFGNIAIGQSAKASGSYSIAIGRLSDAGNIYSTVVGNQAKGNGTYTTAFGNRSYVEATYGVAVGSMASASGTFSTTIGSKTDASGTGALALGYNAKVTSNNSGLIKLGGGASKTVSNSNTFAVKGTSDIKFGINTLTPSDALTVSGSISASGDLYVGGDNVDFTNLPTSSAGANNGGLYTLTGTQVFSGSVQLGGATSKGGIRSEYTSSKFVFIK
jgi:hypothetical protein